MTDLQLKIYNSLGKEVQVFSTQEGRKYKDGEEVGIYTCGPTVYSEPHVGNMRAYYFADILKRTIKYVLGKKVRHVMNVTDVGHLVGDGDSGQDKMEKGAAKEGKSVWAVANTYENNFLQYLKELNIEPHTVVTRATAYIPEQIEIVKQLAEGGYTYVIPGDGIYMDTSKFDNYAQLVGQKHIEGLQSGARVEDTGKKNPTDFALWKLPAPEENRQMNWIFGFIQATADSGQAADNGTPYVIANLPAAGKQTGESVAIAESHSREAGIHKNNSDNNAIQFNQYSGRRVRFPGEKDVYDKGPPLSMEEIREIENQEGIQFIIGFPGWHIECSAMSRAELGDNFDIHTGGVDHIPIHHTNEIAQSECSFCKHGTWVNYRVHGQFLNINGSKVSKSAGDDLSLPGLKARGFHPLDLRYFFLQAHYRSFQDFTWEHLQSAANARKGLIMRVYKLIQSLSDKSLSEFNEDHMYLVNEIYLNQPLYEIIDIQYFSSSCFSDDNSEKSGIIDQKNHYIYRLNNLKNLFNDMLEGAILNDLNTAKLLSAISRAIEILHNPHVFCKLGFKFVGLPLPEEFMKYNTQIVKLLLWFDENVLKIGLIEGIKGLLDNQSSGEDAPAEVHQLAVQRLEKKQQKDFAAADQLRAQIEGLGYLIKDTNTEKKYELIKK